MNGHDTIPISALPEASELDGSELVPIVQAAETRRTTVADIRTSFSVEFSGATLYTPAFSVPSTTGAVYVTFDEVIDDTDGYIVGGDLSQFIAPFPGYYLVQCQLTYQAALDGLRSMTIETSFGGSAAVQDLLTLVTSPAWPLNAAFRTPRCEGGEYFKVNPYQTHPLALDVLCYFSISYLGDRVPPPPPGILLQDNFEDTDGVDLVDHVMDVGPGWVEYGGLTHDINSNEAALTFATVTSPELLFLASDGGAADGTLSCGIGGNTYAGYHLGLAFRGVDVNNFWGFGVDVTQWRLIKFVAGAATTVDSGSADGTVPHTLRVVLLGDDIEAFIDGVSVAVVTDSAHNTGTLFGLWGSRDTGFRWTDFLLEE